MKTLVISDLVTMRSALAQMAGICLLVYVFISFATQSIVAGAAAASRSCARPSAWRPRRR